MSNSRPWPATSGKVPFVDTGSATQEELEKVMATLNDLIRQFNELAEWVGSAADEEDSEQGDEQQEEEGEPGPEQNKDETGTPSQDQPRPVGGGGTSVYPGKVTGGSGASYTVNVYEGGLSNDPISRTVKQLQIDAGETIPVNTWALVAKVGDDYVMQVPVWL